MEPIDEFTSYHEELLDGSYDCVDRIVVNAYFEFAQSAGGFRSWWRMLWGSDETLDRAHMERMSGRFKRRLEAYAKKNKIRPAGEILALNPPCARLRPPQFT